jgi:hypothetical protein
MLGDADFLMNLVGFDEAKSAMVSGCHTSGALIITGAMPPTSPKCKPACSNRRFWRSGWSRKYRCKRGRFRENRRFRKLLSNHCRARAAVNGAFDETFSAKADFERPLAAVGMRRERAQRRP